ncbi:MAG: hypothetical protein J0L87_02225 [Bacteroidetes bacterium]|nr:hypothetical protein [Bacteroidota bacterium]
MSIPKKLSGKWKGEYILGPEYEKNEGRSVEFILELTEDEDGSIRGICIDSDTKSLFSEPIIVLGFVDNDIISFTKKYPFSYYLDENGQAIIDKETDHPEIIYSGEYDHEKNIFKGDFELIIDSQQFGYGFFDDSLTGTWTMSKVS